MSHITRKREIKEEYESSYERAKKRKAEETRKIIQEITGQYDLDDTRKQFSDD